MASKEKKSAIELRALIMDEVRKHPDWDDIVDVAIIQSIRSAPHHPNWDGAFTMAGQRIAPERAFRFVTELKGKFDCVWP